MTGRLHSQEPAGQPAGQQERHRDGGQIALEGLMGIVGVFLVFALLLQFVAFGYGTVLAQKAADSAARAASRAEGSPMAAATTAAGARLPDGADYTVTASGAPPAYRVELSVPTLIPGVAMDLHASAAATAID